MLIDTHCHVLNGEYDDPKLIINESLANGVDKMIINGFDLISSNNAILMSKKFNNVYAAVGIGPENINCYDDKTNDKLQTLIDNNKVVAIGEIGLDYYWTKENKSKQIEVFKNMLSLAKKNNLPVIVHSRDSFSDTYNILKSYGVTGIIHCFSGSLESARMYADLGFLLGIGGVITFKNAKKLVEVVKNIDINNISLETDSPYLSPEPYRGKKNKPYYIKEIVNKLADLKGISVEEIQSITSASVMSKFDLI